ncbi:hypothetical protein PHYPSEUDO_005507 [Phytophthora pseudosyringae]|uniref:Uncharacterized protein n=1 Tax=Phytophthora pseudosyringae TaxID=221518 RepID=A0A8T1VL54_9STRA|nr:hypothetical protein PHYPSEUDO_005507 [Phytophthora pseudosyringae]
MSSSTQASFFWVKYGFGTCCASYAGKEMLQANKRCHGTCADNITPPKMYNANVSCAILRSFVKNTCAKDIEDLCKQKNIQLGIELDALNKIIQAAQARSAASALATGRSVTSVKAGGTGSRPPSGAASSRPITPTMHTGANDSVDDEIAEAIAKKTATENQLEVVAAASKLAKELVAGTAVVDLADDHGARLRLDETGDARASTILKSRAHYTAMAVIVDDKGPPHVLPLVFKLQKPSPTDGSDSRPSSGAAKFTGATVPT